MVDDRRGEISVMIVRWGREGELTEGGLEGNREGENSEGEWGNRDLRVRRTLVQGETR